MSASHTAHDDDAPHETHAHPPMPAVTDEAADTPTWVPITGLALFVLMVMYVMLRAAMTPPEPAPEAAATDEAHGAEVAPAPAAPAPQ